MGFKQLSYWMKGGIIAASIGLVGIIYVMLGQFYFENLGWLHPYLGVISLPLALLPAILSLLHIFGCDPKEQICVAESLLGYLINFILIFGIGALIGLIAEKLKKK